MTTNKSPLGNQATYADLRREEYPSYAEQFDILFHEGVEAWKAVIQETKDKYPKPE
jgi:hypothetical protein